MTVQAIVPAVTAQLVALRARARRTTHVSQPRFAAGRRSAVKKSQQGIGEGGDSPRSRASTDMPCPTMNRRRSPRKIRYWPPAVRCARSPRWRIQFCTVSLETLQYPAT